jgi:hypothetical protein
VNLILIEIKRKTFVGEADKNYKNDMDQIYRYCKVNKIYLSLINNQVTGRTYALDCIDKPFGTSLKDSLISFLDSLPVIIAQEISAVVTEVTNVDCLLKNEDVKDSECEFSFLNKGLYSENAVLVSGYGLKVTVAGGNNRYARKIGQLYLFFKALTRRTPLSYLGLPINTIKKYSN